MRRGDHLYVVRACQLVGVDDGMPRVNCMTAAGRMITLPLPPWLVYRAVAKKNAVRVLIHIPESGPMEAVALRVADERKIISLLPGISFEALFVGLGLGIVGAFSNEYELLLVPLILAALQVVFRSRAHEAARMFHDHDASQMAAVDPRAGHADAGLMRTRRFVDDAGVAGK